MNKLLVALLLFATHAWAQVAAPAVIITDTEQREILSAKTGSRYELLVSLPEGYAANQQRYPVLYVLDGWHFPLVAFLQNNNRFSKRMPAVIVVNVSHGSKNVMALRAHDFTPVAAASVPGAGGAPAFLDFLEQELIPFVDKTYRTTPADRALLGHSFGGLFALYALQQRPALFQRIVAASPVISRDGKQFVAPDQLRAFDPPVRLDLSVGADEPLARQVTDYAAQLDRLKPRNLTYRFTSYPNEEHNSMRLPAFPAGLYWVYGWVPKP
jgi:hypothetical protein